MLQTLGGTQTHLGTEVGTAAAYDIALLDVFWTAMTGYSHALAVARAEGVTARSLAPYAQGIASILPLIFDELAGQVDDNPITSAASSMAHIIATSEAHGIDAGVMRAAEGLARRVIEQGHGTDGFSRVTRILEATAQRKSTFTAAAGGH